jgi:hypothetical protein
VASYNGTVVGGVAPQDVDGTTSMVLDVGGVERTTGGWLMYVSGSVVQSGDIPGRGPGDGKSNREVPDIRRSIP